QPLAAFQVLQHRMVDMRLQVEQAAAAALLAALKPRDPAVISAAKTTIGDAVRFVGQQAVQLHGAMGMTEELRVGHYFRRATVIENQFGDADRHLA
ncbi:acyl-CoA dehydrogenase family protein, partial [Acinetobacter baumannii]